MNQEIVVKCYVTSSSDETYKQEVCIEIDGDEIHIAVGNDNNSTWFTLNKVQAELIAQTIKKLSKYID